MRMSGNPIVQLCYGPIVEKELRVLSRLKRYYVLRCAYILVLASFAFEESWIRACDESREFVDVRSDAAGVERPPWTLLVDCGWW